MSAEWIGFAGAVIAAALGGYFAIRQARLSRLHEAEQVLSRYREPLAAAAFDLQSRLYNMLRQDFFDKYGDGERGEEALTTTLYRIAQYFGWTEIMRRDIQFLSFPEDEDTREVATLQFKIARLFLDDDYGEALMSARTAPTPSRHGSSGSATSSATRRPPRGCGTSSTSSASSCGRSTSAACGTPATSTGRDAAHRYAGTVALKR